MSNDDIDVADDEEDCLKLELDVELEVEFDPLEGDTAKALSINSDTNNGREGGT